MAPLGWLIFLACVGMTAILARRLSGPGPSVALGAALLFASFPALGWAGELAHPVSHDSSMAFLLLALILAVRSLERGGILSALGCGVCVFLDSISDPWAVIALDLPLLVVCLFIAFEGWRTRRGLCAALIAGASVLAFVAIRTHLFGVLRAVARLKPYFTDISGLESNLRWVGLALTDMFNVIPGADTAKPGIEAIDLVLLAALVLPVMAYSAIRFRRAPAGRQLVYGVALLSIVGVAVLFLVQKWPEGEYVGRYFANLYFLGGLLVALAAVDMWSKRRPWICAMVCGYAALFALGGLASRPGLWMGHEPLQSGAQARALAAKLEAHGLTYGYGAYWGAEAPAIQWVSGGRVIVRPISFRSGKVTRKGFQDSSFWYQPADARGAPRRFIVVVADAEECPSEARCLAMALSQFGLPAERFAVENGEVLVWDRSLLGQFGALRP